MWVCSQLRSLEPRCWCRWPTTAEMLETSRGGFGGGFVRAANGWVFERCVCNLGINGHHQREMTFNDIQCSICVISFDTAKKHRLNDSTSRKRTQIKICVFKLGERTQVGTPLPLLPNVCLRDRQTGWSGGQQPASESRHGQLGWKSRLWLWQIQWETGRTHHFDVEKQTWQPSYAIDIIDIIMLSSPVLVSFVKRCRRRWAMTSPPRHWQLAPVCSSRSEVFPFLHDHVVEPSKFGNGMILAADRSCPIHEAHFWHSSLSARLFRPEALHALVACWSCWYFLHFWFGLFGCDGCLWKLLMTSAACTRPQVYISGCKGKNGICENSDLEAGSEFVWFLLSLTDYSGQRQDSWSLRVKICSWCWVWGVFSPLQPAPLHQPPENSLIPEVQFSLHSLLFTTVLVVLLSLTSLVSSRLYSQISSFSSILYSLLF